MDGEIMTEVPQNLQMLVRLVVRGFYCIEDVLIVDMLVRNLCMSEDDICELLKFDRKMLRQRINTLKADKLLQARVKMVTMDDGKSQREQYYFINYTSFVNVVKYKLDHIRKKLEMEERDQTSRASFKCDTCQRSYTDLEADQLLDLTTGELLCIICRSEVREDMSRMPRHDTRILLSNFNNQMEPLFTLLKEVESIKLAAEFSEPTPHDFNGSKNNGANKDKSKSDGRMWSGEASKKSGFQVDSSIDVSINTENGTEEAVETKERPIWLTEATSFIKTNITTADVIRDVSSPITIVENGSNNPIPENDDVLSLLQQHETTQKKSKKQASDSDSEDSADELLKQIEAQSVPKHMPIFLPRDEIEEITISDDSGSHSGSESEPMVRVGGKQVPIAEVDNVAMGKMSQEEKNLYIKAYQDYFGSMDD